MELFASNVNQVHAADERTQLQTFLDQHRRILNESLDGLTEDEVRVRLVPSNTTLLGLLKHAIFVEQVWFVEAITGIHRTQLGLPADASDSFVLTDEDTISNIKSEHRRVCEAAVSAMASLSMDDIVTGHHLGPLTLRWIHLHCIREFAQHCGHADILREQILARRS